MTNKELIAQAISTFDSKVRPATLPLGVKLLVSDDELPPKVKRPSQMGKRWAVCQALFVARAIGWMVALGAEDQACSLAQSLVGFGKIVPFYSEGNLSNGMFTKDLEAGAKSEEVLPKFEFGKYKYILIGPLEKFGDLAPDLVWVYGTPGQVTRLIQASLFESGGSITSSFTGRAGCIGTIAGTILNNQCQVVVNGNGERVFGHAQDHEMSFAIPWSKLEDVINGLEGTHKNGVRYPFPAFFNYTPQFPPKYGALEDLWKE
jgi:uncharacterized protein (DUF169 family)